MNTNKVRMAEWSKAPDSSSGPLTRAWVQIPLLTCSHFSTFFCHAKFYPKTRYCLKILSNTKPSRKLSYSM
ncbi:hypothetical protein HN51_049660 [Arachis hypogaea]